MNVNDPAVPRLSVTDIEVGERDRVDLGDIQELADSIAAVGLLHPVVVTDDAKLLAGDRRLEAVKLLGWAEVPVTVVTLDTVEDVLRAELDENTCRKDLTLVEAARVRERRAKVLAPLAEEREKAGVRQPSPNLGEGSGRKSRETAKKAAAGTGYSGSTLDKVDAVRKAAEDETRPEPVRELAKQETAKLAEPGASADGAYKKLTEAEEFQRAVDDFPDLGYYTDQKPTAIRLAGSLRGYAEPELSMRLDNLRKSIAADIRRKAEPQPEAETDWYRLADEMFVAINAAAQTVGRNGGAETVVHAMPNANQLMAEQWRTQYQSLADTLQQMAEAATPKLRSVK